MTWDEKILFGVASGIFIAMLPLAVIMLAGIRDELAAIRKKLERP
jgi:hypothetical protein